ncbi:unnamed protein product, partial [Prorocentrum cordatum]
RRNRLRRRTRTTKICLPRKGLADWTSASSTWSTEIGSSSSLQGTPQGPPAVRRDGLSNVRAVSTKPFNCVDAGSGGRRLQQPSVLSLADPGMEQISAHTAENPTLGTSLFKHRDLKARHKELHSAMTAHHIPGLQGRPLPRNLRVPSTTSDQDACRYPDRINGTTTQQIRQMIIDSDQPDGPEIVLTSLRAAQADTIFETIMATNRKCTVLALTIEGRLLQEAPQTLLGRSYQNPTPLRRLLLTRGWDGGPSLSRLTDTEPGSRLRWNIADAGQTGQDTVEQARCLHAYHPDFKCYQQMSQVPIRTAASDTMAGAFGGSAYLRTESSEYRIFPATAARGGARRGNSQFSSLQPVAANAEEAIVVHSPAPSFQATGQNLHCATSTKWNVLLNDTSRDALDRRSSREGMDRRPSRATEGRRSSPRGARKKQRRAEEDSGLEDLFGSDEEDDPRCSSGTERPDSDDEELDATPAKHRHKGRAGRGRGGEPPDTTRKPRQLRRCASEDKWFSSCYRTLGGHQGLKRAQHLKVLECIDGRYLAAPLLSEASDNHLARLIFIFTGKGPQTRLASFATRTKREFRIQMRELFTLALERNLVKPPKEFDILDEKLVEAMANEKGWKDEWMFSGKNLEIHQSLGQLQAQQQANIEKVIQQALSAASGSAAEKKGKKEKKAKKQESGEGELVPISAAAERPADHAVLAAAAAGLPSGSAFLMAIDFGSQFFKVAVCAPGKPFEVVLNTHSKRKTPTAVSFYERVRTFGDDAVASAVKGAAKTPAFFPLQLGRNLTAVPEEELSWLPRRFYPFSLGVNESGSLRIDVGEEGYSVEEVAAHVLNFAKGLASTYLDASRPPAAAESTPMTSTTGGRRLYSRLAFNISHWKICLPIQRNIGYSKNESPWSNNASFTDSRQQSTGTHMDTFLILLMITLMFWPRSSASQANSDVGLVGVERRTVNASIKSCARHELWASRLKFTSLHAYFLDDQQVMVREDLQDFAKQRLINSVAIREGDSKMNQVLEKWRFALSPVAPCAVTLGIWELDIISSITFDTFKTSIYLDPFRHYLTMPGVLAAQTRSAAGSGGDGGQGLRDERRKGRIEGGTKEESKQIAEQIPDKQKTLFALMLKQILSQKGKEHTLGPPRVYAMGGPIKGLLTYGDSLGAQNDTDLATAWQECDGYSVEQKCELILFCRQDKVFQKERRRITFATRDAKFRQTLLACLSQVPQTTRKYGRAPASFMERGVQTFWEALQK